VCVSVAIEALFTDPIPNETSFLILLSRIPEAMSHCIKRKKNMDRRDRTEEGNRVMVRRSVEHKVFATT
jgi:hypothetical protein